MLFVSANIFSAIVLKPRIKIDVVVVVIGSIVITIYSVLTLQVSTASLRPHNREPCEIKVVSTLVRFIPAFAPGLVGSVDA
jgi:hypothetical protein